MFATTADRVENNTAPEISERIREKTEASIWYYSRHPELIPRRLGELDRFTELVTASHTRDARIEKAANASGIAAPVPYVNLPPHIHVPCMYVPIKQFSLRNYATIGNGAPVGRSAACRTTGSRAA